jgi:hypothetical protein
MDLPDRCSGETGPRPYGRLWPSLVRSKVQTDTDQGLVQGYEHASHHVRYLTLLCSCIEFGACRRMNLHSTDRRTAQSVARPCRSCRDVRRLFFSPPRFSSLTCTFRRDSAYPCRPKSSTTTCRLPFFLGSSLDFLNPIPPIIIQVSTQFHALAPASPQNAHLANSQNNLTLSLGTILTRSFSSS